MHYKINKHWYPGWMVPVVLTGLAFYYLFVVTGWLVMFIYHLAAGIIQNKRSNDRARTTSSSSQVMR